MKQATAASIRRLAVRLPKIIRSTCPQRPRIPGPRRSLGAFGPLLRAPRLERSSLSFEPLSFELRPGPGGPGGPGPGSSTSQDAAPFHGLTQPQIKSSSAADSYGLRSGPSKLLGGLGCNHLASKIIVLRSSRFLPEQVVSLAVSSFRSLRSKKRKKPSS